jgi:chromosome segregation ATPase
MAGKSVKKTKSALKPKKAKGKVTVKKQPKAKTPVKKTKAQIEKQLALKEAKARLKILRSALREIKAQVKAEREQEPPDISILQADVSAGQARLEKVQSELSQAKALSRKRKDEIDEWKGWYEKLPAEEKSAGLVSLNNEINWRAAELDSNGQKINELMMSEIEATGALEMAKQKLTAFASGVHELPMEKDPRLKNALIEVDKVAAEVARLSPNKSKKK